MFTEYVATYRNLITLKDGTRVLLRPLIKDDRQRLLDMFAHVQPEDARYTRSPILDKKMVERWIDELDYTNVLPVVAVVQDRLVGNVTLHFRKGSARHIGEVRIFIVKEFRKRGLGSHMLRALIDLARKASLHWLYAEVIADHSKVIQAFDGLGFQPKCSFEDAFIFPDGETANTVMLTMRLMPKSEEF